FSARDAEVANVLCTQKYLAEIQPRSYFPDFIAHRSRNERSLRVINDDALLSIEPARTLEHLGANCSNTKRGDAIDQTTAGTVNDLPLPYKPSYEPGDNLCGPSAWKNNSRPGRVAVRSLTCRAFREEVIQFQLRHLQKIIRTH